MNFRKSKRSLWSALGFITLAGMSIFIHSCSGGGSSSGPTPVKGLVVTPGAREVALKWDPEPGVSEYTVIWVTQPSANSGRIMSALRANLSRDINNANSAVVTRPSYFHEGLRPEFETQYVVVVGGREQNNLSDILNNSSLWDSASDAVRAVGTCGNVGLYSCTGRGGPGNCTNLHVDNLNCGACGRVCAQGTTCIEGSCQDTSGWEFLPNNCVNNQPYRCGDSSVENLGGFCSSGNDVWSCGWDCKQCMRDVDTPYMDACVDGRCLQCPYGTYPCRGGANGCVDVQNDTANCGSCGRTCPQGSVCRNHQCVSPATQDASCQGGSVYCPTIGGGPGACFNLTNDPLNCGTCGHYCGRHESCVNSVCVARNTGTAPAPAPAPVNCQAGLTLCGGACVNTLTNRNNCGACGQACPATSPGCTGGKCIII